MSQTKHAGFLSEISVFLDFKIGIMYIQTV